MKKILLNNKNFKILYTNLDCLSNKKDELENLIKLNNVDIALICETLPKNPKDPLANEVNFNIQGYNIKVDNTDRGVCIIHKESFNVIEHHNLQQIYNPSLFVKITSLNKELNLGLIYRSPSHTDKENELINRQIDLAFKQLKNLVLFGDFNYPDIDWLNHYCKKNELDCSSKFLHLIIKNNLNQLVKECTHFKPNCKPSLIDLILTKTPDIINDLNYLPPVGKSHHLTLQLNLNLSPKIKQNSEVITKFDMNKANFDSIRGYLSDVDWDKELKNCNDIDVCWDIFTSHLDHAKSKFIPTKTIKPNNNFKRNFTIDASLHCLIKTKRYYFKLYKKFRNETNYLLYTSARNKVTTKVRSLRKVKEHKIAMTVKSNPKAFYQYIASKTTKKEGVSELIKSDGTLTKNDTEKCETINNFFSSVFTVECTHDLPDFKPIINETISSVNTSTNEIINILNKLDISKSPGPDNLHPKLLKETSCEIAVPLKLLFEKTLLLGKLPKEWKNAEVRPIFKKGDKSDPGNYRPVRLTSIVCKVIETIIKMLYINT